MSTMLEQNAAGGSVVGFMLIKTCDKKVSSKKLPYLDMVLSDKGGEISAKLWDYSPERHGEFGAGDIIKVKGTVDLWNGSPQLRIERIRSKMSTDDVTMEDLIAGTPLAPADMLTIIHQTIDKFENKELSRLVSFLLEQAGDGFLTNSAAVRMHHTMRGGLIYHTFSMMNAAAALCDVYPFLNRDLVLGGIIVHDLGKLKEINYAATGLAVEYTPKGNMTGHLVGGAIDIALAAKELNITDECVTLLQHIVLSHHGVPEFGSPIAPMFPEAQVVATIDKLDAELFEMTSAMSGVAVGTTTSKVWGLDRKLYRHSEDTAYRLSAEEEQGK
ncbi:MAG: HD domain-containing protein [Clostridia bacterium]|nr:HD domain-containing protein [Clostridia bacterium]